jgi:hypothetical protein
MARKRKKIQPLTPEEESAREERYQRLLRAIERLRIELATGKRPAA